VVVLVKNIYVFDRHIRAVVIPNENDDIVIIYSWILLSMILKFSLIVLPFLVNIL
jgi:hypothetical protein